MANIARRHLVFGCALVAALFSYCLLRHGIQAPPDSWAYWEGSVSLLEENRYTYLGGERIWGWPPLFPAYLALVQAVLGKTGSALSFAMCFLTFANTAAWVAFLCSYCDACAVSKSSPTRWMGACFVVLFVAYSSVHLLAQFLLLGFVGLLLLLLVRVPGSAGRQYALLISALAVTQAGALLAHNSALIFIPAAVLALLLDTPRNLRSRVVASCCYAVGGLAPYLLVRLLLHQGHSHPPSKPMYSLGEYLLQSVSGLGQFFSATSSHWASVALSAVIGLSIILFVARPFLSAREPHHAVWRIPVLFAGVSYLCLLALFNMTRIDATLDGRFLLQAPLCLVPAVCVLLARKPLWLFLCLCPLALGMPAFRVLRWGSSGIVSHDRPQYREDVNIHAKYFLTGRKAEAPPPGFIRVRPPTYEWMARWKKQTSPSDQMLVKEE